MTNKLFFASDVHGATTVWKKWLKAPEIYGINIMMMCGDLTGKQLSYIVRENSQYHIPFFDRECITASEEELAQKKRRFRIPGFMFTLAVEEKRKNC